MARRYTKKDARKCGEAFAKGMGKKFGDCWTKKKGGGLKADVGCWNVDYNSIYGGAVITEISNEAGGITHPFGSMRRKPSEFCDTVHFASRAIEIARKGK